MKFVTGILIRIRIVYQESSSVLLGVQRIWEARMSCREEQGTGGYF